MKYVDLTSCVLNDKRALGGKEGTASTDKGIIVMTSYINLKLKNLTASLFLFVPFFF